MFLPVTFDKNEWCVLILLIPLALLVICLPKRFPSIFTLISFLAGIAIAMTADKLVGVGGNDLFDALDTKNYDVFEAVTYIMFGLYSYLFIYLYDYFKIKGIFNSIYILLWSIIAVLVEWFMVYCNVYQYKGWKLSYSFSVYVIVQLIVIILFNFLKKEYSRINESPQK